MLNAGYEKLFVQCIPTSQYEQWPSNLKGVSKPLFFKIGCQRTIVTNFVMGSTNGYKDNMGRGCMFNNKNKVWGGSIRENLTSHTLTKSSLSMTWLDGVIISPALRHPKKAKSITFQN